MKHLFTLFLILSFFSVLTAKTTIICPPPSNVQAAAIHNGVQLSWDYQTPDTVISYNDGYPSGVWNPGQYHALGVVYDLSAFSGATLEQIDFVHYSREKLAGPYLYNLHIYDMDSSKIVATIDSLTADDAYDTPRYEIGVKLDSITAPAHVGIFVEGISLYVDGSKVYSFPAVMSDTSAYVDSVNFYCTDTRDPFYAVDPNYTNIYDAKMVGGAGDKTTNFIIDLWINHENGSTMISPSPLAKKPAFSDYDQARMPELEKSFHLSGNYKSLKEISSNP